MDDMPGLCRSPKTAAAQSSSTQKEWHGRISPASDDLLGHVLVPLQAVSQEKYNNLRRKTHESVQDFRADGISHRLGIGRSLSVEASLVDILTLRRSE